MAGSLNKACLIGNVGANPEVRATQDGRNIASFSLATSESWKDKQTGEKREQTEWHRVVVFNENLVNVVKNYVKKGSKLYIEGTLKTRKWTDKDGIERYATEVVLQAFGGTIAILNRVESDDDAGARDNSYDRPAPSRRNPDAQQQRSRVVEAELDDEIPF